MRKYVLNLSGYICAAIGARELYGLYHQGAIERNTPCRRQGAAAWSTVDDMFPMLKYEPRQGTTYIRPASGPMRRSAAKLLAAPSPDEMVRLMGTLP
jgi:hypothetical protein